LQSRLLKASPSGHATSSLAFQTKSHEWRFGLPVSNPCPSDLNSQVNTCNACKFHDPTRQSFTLSTLTCASRVVGIRTLSYLQSVVICLIYY
jgi:hypothetical protein